MLTIGFLKHLCLYSLCPQGKSLLLLQSWCPDSLRWKQLLRRMLSLCRWEAFPWQGKGPALVTLWALSHVGCDATSTGTGCMGQSCDLFPDTILALPLGFPYTLGLPAVFTSHPCIMKIFDDLDGIWVSKLPVFIHTPMLPSIYRSLPSPSIRCIHLYI